MGFKKMLKEVFESKAEKQKEDDKKKSKERDAKKIQDRRELSELIESMLEDVKKMLLKQDFACTILQDCAEHTGCSETCFSKIILCFASKNRELPKSIPEVDRFSSSSLNICSCISFKLTEQHLQVDKIFHRKMIKEYLQEPTKEGLQENITKFIQQALEDYSN